MKMRSVEGVKCIKAKLNEILQNFFSEFLIFKTENIANKMNFSMYG